MSLTKTSVQLDDKTIQAAKKLWPSLTFSEIVRLALEFAVQQEPKLQTQQAKFVAHDY